MSVSQGLTSLANSNPNFSNQHIQNNIANATVAWIAKTRNIAYRTDISVVLTNSQKTDVYDVMESQSYLNIGRYFLDLDNHTYKILDGSLGETNANDTTTATFLEHLSLVDGIQGVYQSLYGTDADAAGKGIDDFFGSLRGTLISSVEAVGSAVRNINNFSLASQTAYETALQNFINFLDTLGDSTFFNEGTFNTLLSAIETTAATFNSALGASSFQNQKNSLITNRSTIVEQIQKEKNNLGTIRTYSESLTSILTYRSFAGSSKINDIIAKSAQNSAWKDYFSNYETRLSQINPLYDTVSDSSEEEQINAALKRKNLPDVGTYLDTDSVAKKALRDTRLMTRLGDGGKTTDQIIKESCVLLGINITGKDVYAQSKSLLSNMDNHDREIVKQEILLHKQASTNS
jgi:hypothetical protein